MIIEGLFSSVLHKNICCGYALESHWGGNSNEYQQYMFVFFVFVFVFCFFMKINKLSLNCLQIPSLSVPLSIVLVHNLASNMSKKKKSVFRLTITTFKILTHSLE